MIMVEIIWRRKRMKVKKIEVKFRTGILAICSSILTSLLSDRISANLYIVQEKNKQIIIQSMPMLLREMIVEYLKLLGVFFGIWILLNIIVYITEKIYRKVRIRKLFEIKEKEMIQVLAETGQRSEKIYKSIKEIRDDRVKECYVKMNIKEIGSIVLMLYKYFSRPDERGKESLKKIYRKNNKSSFTSLTTGISDYELEGHLTLLQLIIEEVKNIPTSDELLKQDCKSIEILVNEMKNIK